MAFKDATTRRAWFRMRYRRLREEWFLANGPCRKCGSWERLEVDHIDPLRKRGACQIWNWSKPRRDAELSKCQVLCHDCHQAKSVAESKGKPRNWATSVRRAQMAAEQ